ncbi:MAG: polysaccharide deacetylase family protein [Clostridia bacterium]|nr:polysaccharide deacetylase family protein [Clostridia bacterium]
MGVPAGARRTDPSTGPAAPGRVPPDVVLGRLDVGGLTLPALHRQLSELAAAVRTEPVDAAYDRVHKSNVPELDGLELDVEATARSLLNARPGAFARPIYRRVSPAVRLQDLSVAPIRYGQPRKHAVSFLVNVAWGNDVLPSMLSVFDRHRVKGTFFLVGQWAERFGDEARAIAAAGHEIESHGYTTADFQQLSPDATLQQVRRADMAIREVTGRTPRYFSPHAGVLTPTLLQAVGAEGKQLILWSVDTVDWTKPGVDAIVRRVLEKSHPGALILMHPLPETVEALPAVIAGLQQKGLRILTLADLLSPDPLAGSD